MKKMQLLKCLLIVLSIVNFNSFLVANNEVSDTIQLNILFEKTKKEYSSDILTAKKNAIFLVNKSQSINNKRWDAKCTNLLGIIYFQTGNYDSSLVCYNKALHLAEDNNFSDIRVKVIGNLGLLHSRMGNYQKAIEMLYKSLEISEKQNDSINIAKRLADIGNTYLFLNNYKKSLVYLKRALNIFLILKDSTGQSNVLNSLGSVFHDKKDYKSALNYYHQSLDLKLKLNDKKGAVNSYINIADTYIDEKKTDYALSYLFKALDLSLQVNNKDNLSIIYNDIGTIYEGKKNYENAIIYYNKSLDIAREIKMLILVRTASMNLSQVYEKIGDFKTALEYNKFYYTTKIKMSDETINTKINEIETKYETEKKDKALIIKDAEIIKQQADASKKAVQRNAFLIGFFIILLFSTLLFRLFLQKKKANILLANKNFEINKQKEEISIQRDEIEAQRDIVTKQKDHIEEIYQEISDSINYARRIQQAVLPNLELLLTTSNQPCLPAGRYSINGNQSSDYCLPITGYFVLFKPKDIVSGDFYWSTRINEWLIVTVADCTGHGVPGAFMSMLGISFLNEIVRKKEVTKASEVLDYLRESIIEALQQKGTSGEQKDGLDIALCAINMNTLEMQFAGANNPCWIITQFENLEMNQSRPVGVNAFPNLVEPVIELASREHVELVEIKGDKQPIGIHSNMQPFTNQIYQLQKNDTIYLLSDGYEDQFGGPNRKKFLAKNLRNLLTANCQQPIADQKQILETEIIEWIGDGEQIDDITIMGIKI